MQLRKNGRVAMVAAAVVGGLMSRYASGAAQSWDGGAADHNWNNAVNWTTDAVPTGGNATINSVDPASYPIISANPTFTPVDVFVGTGGGNVGRLDLTAGTAATGNGNWMFVGVGGSTGGSFFNVANTGTTGGTTTGFGQGTGSWTDGRLYVGGADFNGQGTGTLNINTSGTITSNSGGPSFSIGHDGTGTLNLDNGTLNGSGEFWIGGAGGANGTLNMAGGTINAASWYVIGRTGTGTVNITGGTINGATGGGNITMGSFTGATGTLNASGGTVATPNAMFVGEGATAVVNVSGTALISVGSTAQGLRLGVNARDATGTVNLNGGTILTPIVTNGAGSGTFNFNGGTLKASADSATFMTGITAASVQNGGAIIDTNNHAITIGQALAAGGSGGLSKIGTGTLTLTGTSTYTGNTSATVGTLALSGTGAVNSSSGITVNGSGVKFIDSSSVAVSPTVTLTNGTVAGTGTINTVNVASSATNTIANGDSTIPTGVLTIGTLAFAGAGNFSLNVASTSPVVATTTLNTNGSGNVLVNATNGTWLPGTYNLISYSTLGGSGFAAFQKGTITGLSGRQSASLTNPAGFVSLLIAGDNPKWTGALNSTWSTATLANPKNWKLITSGTPTDYIDGDVVLFDDTASSFTANITAANVSPTSTTFNNSTNNYTVNGPFGIAGTGTLNKSGTGALTLNSPNTYSGNTTLNAGTLNINNASAIGTGALTINGGTIDNTSGGAITLTTNNAQNWNADITFTGSNSLNMGTGTATINADRTVTTSGAATTLTVGGIAQSGGARALTKVGPGTLAISGTTSSYTGNTNVNAGTLSVTGTLSSSPTININNGATMNVSGTVSDSQTNINNGTATVSGTWTDSGDFWVGLGNGGNGNLQVQNSGTVTANVLLIGAGGSPTAVATGTMSSGGTINTNQWFVIGQSGAVGSSGSFTMNGGTLNVHTNGAAAGNLEVGTFDPANATLDMNAGTIKLQNNASILFGAQGNHTGTSIVNQNGGNVTFYSDGGSTVGGTGSVAFGTAGGGTYTYNLNGGTLTTPQVRQSSGTGTFNFNGGTLTATPGAQTNFMSGLTRANVRNNAGLGAVIDTNGVNVTVAQPLLHSNIGGDAAIDGGLTKNGAGVLTLSGTSTYTGATTIHSGTLQIAAPAVPTLVASYTFDDISTGSPDVSNHTGNTAMDGTVSGSVAVGAPKFGNGSASFGGDGSSVNVSSNITDMSSAAKWSVAGWIKTGTAGSSIFSKNNAGSWQGGDSVFYLIDPAAVGSGSVAGAVRNGGGFIKGGTNLTDDTWHFVVYVDNGGTKQIYTGDGTTLTTETMNATAFTGNDTTNTVQIGTTSDTIVGDGTFPMLGSIDELKFFSGALTPAQIQTLMTTNSASGLTAPPVLPPTTAVNIDTAGAVLDINGNTTTIGSLTGIAGTSVTLGGGILTTGDSTNTAFAGVISGNGGLIKQGSGTFTLSGANTYPGSTNVIGGALTIATAGSVASTSLNTEAGGTLNVNGSVPVTASVTSSGTVNFAGNTTITTSTRTIGSLAVNSGGLAKITASSFPFTPAILRISATPTFGGATAKLDITNNAAIAPGTAASALALLQAGNVISSSVTDANHAIGYINLTGADVGKFEVRYTLKGDTNLDGAVDVGDLGALATSYGITGGQSWANGDFNRDSTVDVGDLGALATNYGTQLAAGPSFDGATIAAAPLALVAGGSAAVPEPTSLGMLAIGTIGLLSGRRRRHRGDRVVD